MGAAAQKMTGEMGVVEAAAYCGMRPKTLYNKIALGQGPRHKKEFGRLVFLAADLDVWKQFNTETRKAFRR